MQPQKCKDDDGCDENAGRWKDWSQLLIDCLAGVGLRSAGACFGRCFPGGGRPLSKQSRYGPWARGLGRNNSVHRHKLNPLLPRDATLARCVTTRLSVSVCLSVTSGRSIETIGRIEPVLAVFHISYTVLRRNSGIYKHKGFLSLKLSLKLCGLLENFAMHGTSIVATCSQLRSTTLDA